MRNKELCGLCGDLLQHHFVNDLGRAFVFCRCFCQKVVQGAFGQPQLPQFPLDEPVAARGSKYRDRTGHFLVQGIIFFVSQIGIGHVPSLAQNAGESKKTKGSKQ